MHADKQTSESNSSHGLEDRRLSVHTTDGYSGVAQIRRLTRVNSRRRPYPRRSRSTSSPVDAYVGSEPGASEHR